MDNETWIIEIGNQILERKASSEVIVLSDIELLTYYFWVADYGMRNAGDLEVSYDLERSFHSDGLRIAESLQLSTIINLFSKKQKEFEELYFTIFDNICKELRTVFEENNA